jgi:hypothetical protein
MTEQELLADTLQRLNRAGISYMLTGSMASNYWGIPRTTHDLDFVIQLPSAAIPKLVEAFREVFAIDEQSVRDAYRPPHQFNVIDERSALKVDFWLLKPEPFERLMFSRRVKRPLFGQDAWLATAEDVILHKLVWNRISPSDRQLGDCAGIVAVQSGQLDLDYMKQEAAELELREDLERLLSGAIRPKTT